MDLRRAQSLMLKYAFLYIFLIIFINKKPPRKTLVYKARVLLTRGGGWQMKYF
jgi:hypothetical protein